MNRLYHDKIEREIEMYDRMLIAAESWSDTYKKDELTYNALIKQEAVLAKDIRKLFRDYSNKVEQYFNSYAYGQLKAAEYTVDTVVTGDFFDGLDSDFITIAFDTLALSTAIGAQAGESIYNINLGIKSTDAAIQELTNKQIAWLVGKKVGKDGLLVDNPNSEYRMSDKTREDIASAIKTSISLSESREDAIARIKKVVNNEKRASVIAQTETVNAYSNGMLEFARQSGATGKEWQDIGAIDQCNTFSREGVVPLDHKYNFNGYEMLSPVAHPGCRCGIRLAYANEYKG